MPVTYIIIAFTCLVSISAFNNRDITIKMKHWPYEEKRKGEYFRWLTCGFLHGDPMHLIFNMLALYFFGAGEGINGLENKFEYQFPGFGNTLFLIFYLLATVAASSATYYRYKDQPHFASIGASGAVAAVIFASILFDPLSSIFFLFVPFPIKGFIFAIIYLVYSAYASKKGGDNIDHLAHYYGAVFGFCFPLVLQPSLLSDFVQQMVAWLQSF